MVEPFPSLIQCRVLDSFWTSDHEPVTILHRHLPPRNRWVLWWRFFHATYPEFITNQSMHINGLEIRAVTVSVKLWASVLPRQRILILTDNKSTELALNSGKSCVSFTQACLRELWLYAGRYDFEISTHHIAGSQNIHKTKKHNLVHLNLNNSYLKLVFNT